MEEDDVFLQTLAPRNIVGVHNYCDGWCERCGFADRCVVIATVQKECPLPPGQDPLIDHLKDRFDQVRVLIETRSTFNPADLELDLDPPDAAERAKQDARREKLGSHPLVREAYCYWGLVRGWFEAETEGLRVHADALVQRARSEDVEDLPLSSELARIVDSIDIVRWDSFLIVAKLRRAIDGCDDARDGSEDDPVQNDYNGSAKVALTVIDRSEGAWRSIDRWFPSSGGGVLLADQLAALREAVEVEFPRARAFLRPGFDGLVTPE